MTPTLVLYNVKIYTVDPLQSWAEAVACHNGYIVAVGSNDEILALAGPATQRIDGGGQLVLPGLTDAHVHFLQHAVRSHQISLFGVASMAEALQQVQQAVDNAVPGEWVQGWGYDEHRWEAQPTAALLDDIAPNTPVVLARMDMHTWWVNSAVLQRANITAQTPDLPESRIERDASGNPTGILREWNAIQLVQEHIPRPKSSALKGWLQEAIAQAHSLGLTAIHDQRVEREGRQSLRLYQALDREDALKLRIHCNLAADFLPEVASLGLQPGFGNERLWLGHLKAFADGTMGSQTAWMLAPFEGSKDNTGIVVTPTEELTGIAAAAARAGFSLSVHAIGDRAVREVVGVMSEFPPDASRGQLPHRIEHVQVIDPTDLAQLSRYGIVASMQPVHLQTDWHTADKVWGQRARYAYAFRSLLEQGTTLAFGSDAPVAPLKPMLGIAAAVSRQDMQQQPAEGWYPQEKIGLAETIAAYTMGPAQLAGKARLQGSISPGKWADMIVLDRNLFELEASQLAAAQVVLTIFAGQVVFER